MLKKTISVQQPLAPKVRDYLSSIGRIGGKKSRRLLSPQDARNMVKLREARRAYNKYYFQCFWSYDPHFKVELNDIPWVADHLMRYGNRSLWILGSKLCR